MSRGAPRTRGSALGHRPAGRAVPTATDAALLAVAVCAVSTSAPLTRLAAVPALGIAFWRNAFAAAALLIPAAGRGRRREMHAMTRSERRLAVTSGALLAAHFATWIPSLSFTTVASSVALVATQPVWSAVIQRLRGDAVPTRTWFGIGAAVAGAVLLSGVDVAASGRAALGDGLALAGGVLAAVYIAVGAEVRKTVSTTVYTTVCYTVAALGLLVVALVGGAGLWGYPAQAWWCIVGLTVGAQFLGHSVFNRLLRTTGPTVVSVAVLFEIVGATLLAAWWFGERPPLATIPAAVLIGIGVLLVATTPVPVIEPTSGG